ncbi:MAG: hypothetical protein HY822_09715 [Acidobacteria bacterium]|nr:hypothetical protein [Acidobacteriota bacterium]
MVRKLTRRQLAGAAAGAVSASRLAAQAPASEENLLQQARELVRKNAGQLTRREVPMSTEPAFQFRA